MKPVLFAMALMSALTLCAKDVKKAARLMPAPVVTETAAADDGWMVDYEAAKAKAKQLKRPVFLQFTGSDWCGWCMMMDKEVFASDAWKRYAAENLVAVKLDFPRRKDNAAELRAKHMPIAQKYGVRGYPTYVILDADGNEIGRMGASRGIKPAAFIEQLTKIVKPIATAAAAAPADVDADGWMADFEAAKAKAKQLNRPVFLQFTGSDWCGWCIMMDKKVFATDAWKQYAEKNLVAVKADFPNKKPISAEQKAKNEALSKKFGIRGFPTYLIFDANGNMIGRLGASRGITPEKFLEQLSDVLKK